MAVAYSGDTLTGIRTPLCWTPLCPGSPDTTHWTTRCVQYETALRRPEDPSARHKAGCDATGAPDGFFDLSGTQRLAHILMAPNNK